jgi:hypothetical protein
LIAGEALYFRERELRPQIDERVLVPADEDHPFGSVVHNVVHNSLALRFLTMS